MSTNPRKRDPRMQRTRMLLRASLVELIPRKGFAQITIQDIADQATLNRATFYLHYRDKVELLMDVFQELISDAAPMPPSEPPLEDSARESIVRVFNHIARHADFFRVMLAEESVPAFTSRVRHYIEEVGLKWISAMQPDEGRYIVSPEIAINFIGEAYLGAIIWWLQKGMPHSADYMASQLMRLTNLGLRRAMGLEEGE